MQLECLLVEDDVAFATDFAAQLSAFPFIKTVHHCASYSDAVSLLNSTRIDLLLLDIVLNSKDGLSGFDLIRHRRNLPPVIIVTNAPENAIESYNLGVTKDFLVKPFTNDRLLLALNRAMEKTLPPSHFLSQQEVFFKSGRRFHKFNLAEIVYFEGYGMYTKVNYKGEAHIINEQLVSLEKTLDAKQFMRVHKSYIINMELLEGFDHNNLYLKGGVAVPIGVSYKAKLDILLRLFDKPTLDTEPEEK